MSSYQTDVQGLHQALAAIPTQPFAHLPTPLEPLHQLTELLRAQGPAPELWIKRDDCTGLAGGGNKTRKLEYLIADAKAAGADTVMTFGAVQSNHARQTAAACAQAGFGCELILSRQVPSSQSDYEQTGNVLLDDLCGARFHIIEPQAAKAVAQDRQTELEQAGKRVYRIPAGGSNATGALGYVQCALEIQSQLEALQLSCQGIVHASSSAGTQAGLLFGLLQLDAQAFGGNEALPTLCGVNVYHPEETVLAERIATLCTRLSARLDLVLPPGWEQQIRLDSSALGAGYGVPNADTLAAIRLLAQSQGILLDPAYSGKAFAALLAQIAQGQYRDNERIIFIHTGGSMVLPAYRETFVQSTN